MATRILEVIDRVISRYRGVAAKSDTLWCIRQIDTWQWPAHLDNRMEGECAKCKTKIYFEAKNARARRKLCYQCGAYGADKSSSTTGSGQGGNDGA